MAKTSKSADTEKEPEETPAQLDQQASTQSADAIQETPQVPQELPREPIVGEVVNYVVDDGKHLGAAVHAVFVNEPGQPHGRLELRVLDPSNAQLNFRASPVAYDGNKSPGTWHFIEQ